MSTELKLTFLGAAGTVTGSKYLDAVVLTHAHLDHSGYLPVLIKRGFTGAVYCTGGTRALCGILLPDSGHLQEEDARYANEKRFSKHRPALPLYTREDAERALQRFRTVATNESLALTTSVSIRFHPVGHILGAASVEAAIGDERLLFSGDVGRPSDPVMKPPEPLRRTDHFVVESTYGDCLHPDTDVKEALAEKAFAGDARNTILFAGYQAAGTRGAALVGGASEVRIHDQQHKVRAEVTQVTGLSAHADYRELIEWLKPASAPSRCFITHGVPTASAALKAQLLDELGWRAEVPNDGDTVSIRLRA